MCTAHLTTADVLSIIPNAKTNKAVSDGKKKDKAFNLHCTKVRAVAQCSSCAQQHMLCFSMKMVGSSDGPPKKDFENLKEVSLERDGYVAAKLEENRE